MRKNIIFKTFCVILAVSMMLLTAAGCGKKTTGNEILDVYSGKKEYKQTEYSEIAETFKKQETVYVNLAPDGTASNITVTDWIHTDMPQVRVADVSSLQNIRNVKTLVEPITDGENIFWDMDTTDIYYSGETDTEPPVMFNIRYFLEGTEMTAEQIAGKKGNVKIQIEAKNNLTVPMKIKGKDFTISCPMIMIGGTILSEGVFSNISIDNGSKISDGDKEILFFFGVPGMDESLGISDLGFDFIDYGLYSNVYCISAYTESFELGNLMFAVMPLASIGNLGNGGLPTSVESIKKVIGDIENIQNALTGLDIDKIVNLLYGDSNKLEDMLDAVSDAVVLYEENEKLIKVIGKYMTDENLAKLDKLAKDLERTDMNAVANTLSDPTVRRLLNVLPQLSSSLSSFSVLAQDLNAVMPILQALMNEMDSDPELQKSLENLPQTLAELKRILAVIEANKDLLDAIADLSNADSAEKLEAIMETADKYGALGALNDKDTDLLAERVKQWVNIGMQYRIFTECPIEAEASVMFVYKTAAVHA